MKSAAVIIVLCAALPGCAVQLHGNQSASGGVNTAASSSRVVASAATSNARVSFSSGQAVPAGAPGGQLTLGSGRAAGVLIVGVAIAEFLNAIGAADRPRPGSLPPDARIAHTCSCYGYKPPEPADGDVASDRR